ncbi:unnamed protein product [Didymodactylos carnosus]|uniref:Uncharacterized protein n=1 Tax=Didymodactylos carnosus TaxID=1234261 RepID=A0A815JU38_9BILA|nr:unnamed protein product [Didymodactylos carnosus]CAF4281140.1 unnamed protein product [Didymodactylos carnosus]
MQNTAGKKQHSYRKVEQLEREIIVGLVEQFGNSAPAIANFIRSSGQKYSDIGFYYQQIAYGSARKRVYDILKELHKDKLDYISTNDDIDEKEKEIFFLFHQQQPSNTPTLSGKQPDTSTSPLTVFIDHSQSNDLLLYSSSSPLNLPFIPDQNDSADD